MPDNARQVISVTHNPNLAVGADAEQISYVTLDKAAGYNFKHQSGSIENPQINDAIVEILEGSKPAFVQHLLKYQIRGELVQDAEVPALRPSTE